MDDIEKFAMKKVINDKHKPASWLHVYMERGIFYARDTHLRLILLGGCFQFIFLYPCVPTGVHSVEECQYRAGEKDTSSCKMGKKRNFVYIFFSLYHH